MLLIFTKDSSRHNVATQAPLFLQVKKPLRQRTPERPSTAGARLPVSAPLITQANSENERGAPPRPTTSLGQTTQYIQSSPSSVRPLPASSVAFPTTGITDFSQPPSELSVTKSSVLPTPSDNNNPESHITALEHDHDDEYQMLNKDDIPNVDSESDRPGQKPGGWPKYVSNVRWISGDEKDEKPNFLSRPVKERQQTPTENETQTPLASDKILTTDQESMPIKKGTNRRMLINQSGGSIAVLGLR